jgi:nucleotide-binding universal stress UspA family protein
MARTAFELRRILVPVDFSGPSELAPQWAAAFAARFGGKIALVHVIESGRLVGELSESDTGMTEIPRRVEEQLCMLASRSGEPALFDKVEVRTGRPSQNIGRAASELGSDLIVISTHGYTGLNYVLLGGTAERVIRHAPCPVLVVRRQDGHAPEPKKILVPVDFSPASLDGLRYALGLARPFGARLTAFHVIEPLGPMARLGVDVDAHERKLRADVRLGLEGLRLEVDEPAGAFDSLFREGTSYHEIVGMAQRGDFDLIIMASLGRSGLVDMLLGSTAERVVRHAPCPVLVVREPRESKTQTT